jgi:uncharacterized protein
MENRPLDYSQHGQTQVLAKTFMSSVFSWMFLALSITGVIAYMVGSNEELIIKLFYNIETGKISILGYGIMFAPLIFSLLFGFTFHKLSYPVVLVLFIAFAGVMGLSLSTIFMAFTSGSIFMTFGICAGMFGLMALVGYTTKTDLSRLGPILGMGVIGIVICSIINMFFYSGTMNMILGFLGVIVFTALTAYEIQQLKRIGAGIEYQGAAANKLSLFGAFQLYITFINLFISLLRLFGERR